MQATLTATFRYRTHLFLSGISKGQASQPHPLGAEVPATHVICHKRINARDIMEGFPDFNPDSRFVVTIPGLVGSGHFEHS